MSDLTPEFRKKDHIDLAFKSQAEVLLNDTRFYYEPIIAAHPELPYVKTSFLGKELNFPLWISSMTGGTNLAGTINKNLALACNEFKIGMGLGSCRVLLGSQSHFTDFNLRPIIGDELPFFANLGIAQIEKLIAAKEVYKIKNLIEKLNADGLIIHVNPFQEWLQPEGDRISAPPLQTIAHFLGEVAFPVIVKEVGQGMGPESLKALLQLPLAAIDFGAYGGTNFSKLELLRADKDQAALYNDLSYIGHTAEDMVMFINAIAADPRNKVICKEIIISGGIKNFLDGYYYMKKINMHAIYAQGSAFLKYAALSYNDLKTYIKSQTDGLALCNAFLKTK